VLIIDLHPGALGCDPERARREAVGGSKAEVEALHRPVTLRNPSVRESCEPTPGRNLAPDCNAASTPDDRIRV
jgi:hypothetical protein